jgi:hypothetical protein
MEFDTVLPLKRVQLYYCLTTDRGSVVTHTVLQLMRVQLRYNLRTDGGPVVIQLTTDMGAVVPQSDNGRGSTCDTVKQLMRAQL